MGDQLMIKLVGASAERFILSVYRDEPALGDRVQLPIIA
jgi:hypothetical protein